MGISSIQRRYPNLRETGATKIQEFITNRCSEYYFLDYMRCSTGVADDAIEFYLLDADLRTLLLHYFIQFELQAKADFVSCLEASTDSPLFWKEKKFFLAEATISRQNTKSKFVELMNKIEKAMEQKPKVVYEKSGDIAMYCSSFGTFQSLFKLIDGRYKTEFVQRYTVGLGKHDYRTLNTYFEAIRRIRNRCAHGNHVVSLDMVNELNNLKPALTMAIPSFNHGVHYTALESVVFYLTYHLKCGERLRKELSNLVSKRAVLLKKYKGRHAFSGDAKLKYIDFGTSYPYDFGR